jgi:hypothetical protein
MEPDDLLCSRNARPHHQKRSRLRLRLSTDNPLRHLFDPCLGLSLGLPMSCAPRKINQPPFLKR